MAGAGQLRGHDGRGDLPHPRRQSRIQGWARRHATDSAAGPAGGTVSTRAGGHGTIRVVTTDRPLTVTDAAARLRSGELTSVELTRQCLDAADRLDGEIGTYLVRFDDAALRRPRAADAELAAGDDRGPLHGDPLGVKDILAMAEGPTTAQSLVLDPAWGAGKDAPVVARLQGGAARSSPASPRRWSSPAASPTRPSPSRSRATRGTLDVARRLQLGHRQRHRRRHVPRRHRHRHRRQHPHPGGVLRHRPG